MTTVFAVSLTVVIQGCKKWNSVTNTKLMSNVMSWNACLFLTRTALVLNAKFLLVMKSRLTLHGCDIQTTPCPWHSQGSYFHNLVLVDTQSHGNISCLFCSLMLFLQVTNFFPLLNSKPILRVEQIVKMCSTDQTKERHP